MLKYIGQHIVDLIARFRSDVYLENLIEQEEEYTVMVTADGQLVKSTHPGERSRLQVRNDEGSTIPAGAPLYSRGEIGGSERIKVGIADANDSSKMPCIGIAEAEMNTSSTKDNFAITQGVYNTNISGFTGLSEGDILYVDDSGSAPYLTHDKSDIAGSGSAIQNVGIVLKTNGSICQGLLVSAIGRSNDVPNLNENAIFLGNSSNQAGVTDAPMVGVITAANAAAARTVLGVDAAGTDNSTDVTLVGRDYLSLSGQQITANDIDLTDDVTGTLPESNGGTGVTDVKTIVTRQAYSANFLDDLGTTKHYLPIVDSPNEQTTVYRHEVAMTAPCDGRVASVTIRFENLNTHSGNANVTLGVESRVAGLSYAGTWTVEETETVAIPDTADHDTVHFHFANDKHFDSAELFAVSIQSDTDITGTNERFWVTVVVEWDWSTYLGTKGTSAIYSSTP